MLRYEALFLAVPEITADESSAIESQLDAAVSSHKGNVISFERWGKYKLAYPVRRYDYGVYYLLRFEVDDKNKFNLNEQIKNVFAVKQHELVMRYVLNSLPSHGSLEYKRGESLEEVPTQDVDSFLKENKMSGLMGKQYSSHSDNNDSVDIEQ